MVENLANWTNVPLASFGGTPDTTSTTTPVFNLFEHRFHPEYAMSFQHHVIDDHVVEFCNTTSKLLTSNPHEKFIFVSERSIFTNVRIFVRQMRDQGKISEIDAKLLLKKGNDYFEMIQNLFNFSIVFIHLNDDPSDIYERLKRRNRLHEETLSLSYVLDLKRRYEELFNDPGFPYRVMEIELGDYRLFGSSDIDIDAIIHAVMESI